MKTKTLTLALVFAFCAQFSFSNNLNLELTEENYIDDIPFNTEEIVSSIPYYTPPYTIILMDESYIDDIPFCTKSIYDSVRLLYKFQLDTESYIDDIPFSTERIYHEYLANQNEVNDVPLDNEEIAMNNLMADNNMELEEEEYIDDIPFDTYLVAINTIDYFQVLLSNINSEVQLIISDYYSEQIEELTQNFLESIIKKFKNKTVNIIEIDAGSRRIYVK